MRKNQISSNRAKKIIGGLFSCWVGQVHCYSLVFIFIHPELSIISFPLQLGARIPQIC